MLRKEMRRRARRAALRSRIIAGVTAIAIGLGLAAGGTAAAFATGGPADSPCSKDDRFDGGTKYDIGKDVKSTGTLTFDWGTLTWSKKQLVFTAVPGWTVDLCVKGGSQEPNSIRLDTGSITIDRLQDISHFMWANPTSVSPKPIYEVGLYIYKKLDPTKPASWPNSGPQTFITSQPGTEWFTKFPAVLPDGVCGPGWAVQQDKVKHWGNFTWPSSITYPHDNIGWPPIYAAQHKDLESYLTVPPCGPPTLPTIAVTGSSLPLGCSTDGSFTVGLGLNETRGDKLTWSTSMSGAPALPGTVPVGSVTTITVTVDVRPEFETQFGVVDESGRGVVDPVTGAITFTFVFDRPEGPCGIAPIPTKLTCMTDGVAGYLLPAIEGVSWLVNGEKREGRTEPYLVNSTGEVTITFEIDGPYVLAPDALERFVFGFGLGDLCDLPEYPSTNAFVKLTASCELGQTLDPATFQIDDPELVRFAPELSDLVGPDYAVVFVVTDDAARFYDSSTPPAGRVVSDGGRTLTYSGTLLGPESMPGCVTVELKDPVSYIDTCLGASFTVYRVEGIVYTVYRNDDEPFVVPWSGSQQTATYAVNQGDSVRVVPSPASDRFTISPDPAPFERTFAVYQGDCLPTLPLTEASARLTPASCVDTTNWLTMAAEPGVQWWVNGVKAEAGTWAKQPGSFVVEATPLPGYGFPLESQTRWEFTATAVDDDCLPTLAFTGSSPLAGTIGIAGLALMVFGLGLLAWRRQQA